MLILALEKLGVHIIFARIVATLDSQLPSYEYARKKFSISGKLKIYMSGKSFAFQEKSRYVRENFGIPEKIGDLSPPPDRQQFLEKILILSHRSLRLGPLRRCSFVVFFKTQHVPE
jgi:hypothetical protein